MNRRNFLKALGSTVATVPFLSFNLESNILEPSNVVPEHYVNLIGKNDGAKLCIFNSEDNTIYYNGEYKEGIISLDFLHEPTPIRVHVIQPGKQFFSADLHSSSNENKLRINLKEDFAYYS